MSFITPSEIPKKAKAVYKRFLAAWVRGEADHFFPCRIRASLSPDKKNPAAAIAASEALLVGSKSQRGWGYTVHRDTIESRSLGNNPFPTAITIDSLDDLLKLAGATDEFHEQRYVVETLRRELPELESWIVSHINTLGALGDRIDNLIQVTQFFRENNWPDCYARQIPVSVDTKFVERNTSVLRQWLDLLLPDTAIDPNETKFARRFGLRDGQQHRAIRLLDQNLASELRLPFDELSLPLRSIAQLQAHDVQVFIVENDLNLLTLPHIPRGLALRGEGNAVNRLESVIWLHDNQIRYWGDVDVDGFLILSRLRNIFSQATSIMMDCETLDQHPDQIVEGNGKVCAAPTNLTQAESAAFERCANANERLEQEKILQPYVDTRFAFNHVFE